ncbi:hypothetical protein BG004_001921 [Podila humilis]|nr:hypothetical protein BG004_001921 [Podila humilis]
MATYKQRTPYVRHASTDRHSFDNDPQTLQSTSTGTARQPLTTFAASVVHACSHQALHSDDTILDNRALDQEWTSARHTASARARARQQQQYFDQQQQRTREWQFVLEQHHHHHHRQQQQQQLHSLSVSNTRNTAIDAARLLSSDELDSLTIASTDTGLTLQRPGAVDARASGDSSFEHSSVFGFSDLTSEGLESGGDSEDLDVWSQDDDESVSLFAPSFRRVSGPHSPADFSPTTSLSNLPRPSFASHPSQSPQTPLQSRFQNQMPLHDGSGNFTGQSPRSSVGMSQEADLATHNIVLGDSTIRHKLDANPPNVRPRITSAEFASVIQNIANLQVQAGVNSNNIISHAVSSGRNGRRFSFRLSPASNFAAPGTGSQANAFNRSLKLQNIDDLDLVKTLAHLPSKLGWFEAFEQTLCLLHGGQHAEFDLTVEGGGLEVAIKTWASQQDYTHNTASTLEVVPEENSSDSEARLEEVKKNMSAASMEAMQRLQMRKLTHSPSRNRYMFPIRLSDPMQIDFVPTIMDQSEQESTKSAKSRRTTSRSTGTSTSHQGSRISESTLLSVFISTLRRLGNHVASNFIYHNYLEDDEDMISNRLGFEGDLGIEWGTGGGTGGTSASTLNSHDHHQHYYARRDREMRHNQGPERVSNAIPRLSSRASSRASSCSSSRRRPMVRRASSDCGLESLRHFGGRQEQIPIH